MQATDRSRVLRLTAKRSPVFKLVSGNKMKNISKFAIRSLALFAVFAAIATAASAQGLTDRTWRLTELNGKRLAESKASISFDDYDRSVSGNGGCNRLRGTFYALQKRLTFSAVATTKMACADSGSNRVESEFLKALSRIDSFSIRSGVLTLYAKSKVLIRLKDDNKTEKTASAGHEFDGNKWMLHSIKGIEVAEQNRSAFVVFNASSGSASGNSDCNAFGGTFRSEGDTIGVRDLMSTMRACFEDGTMDVERSLLNGLQAANRYQVNSGKLELYDDSQLLLTFQRN